MKRIVMILLLALPFAVLNGQNLTPVPEEGLAAAMEALTGEGTRINSLKADFVQERINSMLSEKAVSEGSMSYEDGKLEWCYMKPYSLTLRVEGEVMTVTGNDSVREISLNDNRIARRIVPLAVSNVTRNDLSGGGVFSVSLFTDDKGLYVAELTPLKRDMRQMFQTIRLWYGADCHVKKVELLETASDKTVISFSNQIIR